MAPTPSRRARRATIRDVAERAGVSVATVSRILNGTYNAPAATEAKVLRAASELDYVANANARELNFATSRTIGIVAPMLNSPFFMNIAAGIEAQAGLEGRVCVMVSTGADETREWEALGILRERGVEAIIMVGGTTRDPHHDEKLIAVARSLHESGSRLVLCVRRNLPADVPAIHVDFDNEGGSYAATSHLLSMGHRRILYLGGAPDLHFTAARLKGYRQALSDYGVAHDDALVQLVSLDREDIMRLTSELVSAGLQFTAVFAANDHVAAAAIVALRSAGLDVPGDVSVVGYNDTALAAGLIPALTTVHVPQVDLGRMAVRAAFTPIGTTVGNHTLGTHVVVRDSVRPPRRPPDQA